MFYTTVQRVGRRFSQFIYPEELTIFLNYTISSSSVLYRSGAGLGVVSTSSIIRIGQQSRKGVQSSSSQYNIRRSITILVLNIRSIVDLRPPLSYISTPLFIIIYSSYISTFSYRYIPYQFSRVPVPPQRGLDTFISPRSIYILLASIITLAISSYTISRRILIIGLYIFIIISFYPLRSRSIKITFSPQKRAVQVSRAILLLIQKVTLVILLSLLGQYTNLYPARQYIISLYSISS